ncbi:MAG: amidophosphoribosyltransferase [Brevundimonas sp. 32-68-21]|jgi:ComF family protein|uniref:ComF family protein n=1 Tax=Brevundimonas mediterranea TaxID=74329 RepID=A0AB37E6C0_9CAUL|nr:MULTISPECIES: ComF family protein [Brevundimonas]EDX79350.1 Phosphoribosyl transferase domain protein [Brevundimonas sp. BAL3]MBA4330760.1 amidophosphoribosyltransferase [Brevundimonas sp.]OYX79461.1 MAG: amidophosphoribosyltransferase [Brevundimonas sp. 32-68-21]QIH72895.1 ComF family protein [Brevundimonas mediterranea]
MMMQDGGWRRAWEGAGRQLRDMGRGLADLVLPPLAHDSREATAAAGLTPDAWSRIKFLDAPVCDGCGAAFEFDGGAFAETRCAACIAQPYVFARARAACVYDDHSRSLILRYKHGDQQQFASLFARWIGRAATDLIQDADAVVPVPLHPFRLLSRRFNQAAEIARPLAGHARLDYLPDALTRRTHTTSQGGKSRRGRRLNVKKAFIVSEIGRRRIKGRRILLIDDVLTTGATGEACARALIDAGARAVDLAVIARVRNARELTM